MKMAVILIASAGISLFASYAVVIVFLMFGPTYLGDDLAIKKAGMLTLALSIVVVYPVYVLLRRRFLGKHGS